MTPIADAFMQRLHGRNVYDGFAAADWPDDAHGGGGHAIFAQVFQAVRPGLVVEVGSWKGSSAIRMAGLMKELDIPGVVVCVDTWLGGVDHIGQVSMTDDWDIERYKEHGYPRLYYQFLANVVHAGLQDYIVPFPNASHIAARWLLKAGVQPDLVYIDASHEEEDVYLDLLYYWRALRPGGVMFGDDWSPQYWPGVVNAVSQFARERGLAVHTEGVNWLLMKPAEQEAAA